MNHTKFWLLLGAALASAAAFGADLASAQRDADKMAKAMVTRDYKTVAALTHPVVVKGAGGPEATAKAVEKANAQLSYKKMEFAKPQQITEVGSTLIGVFPYHSEITYQGKLLGVDSFFIGFSSDKAHWFFIDCEGVTHDYIAHLVPGYKNTLNLKGC